MAHDCRGISGPLEIPLLDFEYLKAAVRSLAEEAGLPELLPCWIHLKEEILG
ncbi:MAG TPA: hypothetical protein VNK89_04875 [Thermoflexus sp.]|nr:hypothetical protein [Thermoflexus sp.]